MTRVLVTAFEPFGGSDRNASSEAVGLLPTSIDGAEVVPAVLPCVFGESARAIVALIDAHVPDIVIAVGEASGRSRVDLERVAINVDDARIPDNAGNSPVDEAIEPSGPPAYFSTLPIKACAAAVEATGVSGGVSSTAGTFVCNHVFYALMHTITERRGDIRAGFVHVPTLDRLSASDAATALEAIVRTTMATDEDIRVSAGSEH